MVIRKLAFLNVEDLKSLFMYMNSLLILERAHELGITVLSQMNKLRYEKIE